MKNKQIVAPKTLNEILALLDEKIRNEKPTTFVADAEFITGRLRAEFVAQVRDEMNDRDITDRELASLAGISPQRMSKILREEGNIELRTIAKIAFALKAPVTLRIGRKNMPGPANAIKEIKPAFYQTRETNLRKGSWGQGLKLRERIPESFKSISLTSPFPEFKWVKA